MLFYDQMFLRLETKQKKKSMITLITTFSYLKKIPASFISFVNVTCYILCIIRVNAFFTAFVG